MYVLKNEIREKIKNARRKNTRIEKVGQEEALNKFYKPPSACLENE